MPTPESPAASRPVATDALPDPTTFAEAETNSFRTVFERYSRQRDVVANEDVPEDESSTDLHLSEEGFAALPLPEGARFIRLGGPNMQVLERPATILENQQVDQLILHGVGWTYDRQYLAGQQAGSPVEEGSGYNPAKVATLLQQYLGGRRQAPHCLVSRRGDIYCLIPWSKGTPLSAPARSSDDIPQRSISVALEMRYTARTTAYVAGQRDIPIAMAEPITAAQATAVAFLAKKLMAWAGLTELPVLEGTSDEIRPRLGTNGGHVPGMVAYGAYDYELADQMAPEFLLPQSWLVGGFDTLPAQLKRSDVARAWRARVEQGYPAMGFTEGTPGSAWPQVTSRLAGLPVYDFATQLFAPANSSRVFEAARPVDPVTAPNESARASMGEGYQRARDMSMSIRSALYDAAGVALDAVMIATMEKEARNRYVEDGVTHVIVAQHALGFDFNSGEWRHMDVPIQPGPGSVTVRERTPAVTPPPGATPAR